MLRNLIWLLIAAYAAPVIAECTASSGPSRVSLLELYTSEGCSSCPPADEWLSSINKAGFGPDKVVPLAFHVDYWDYIGWKDRFAKASYSDRQRQVAALGRSRFVYTPQVVLNGGDYRGWGRPATLNESLDHHAQLAEAAKLSLKLSTSNIGEMSLTTSASILQQEERKHADVYVALYENKLSSEVRAGENKGRQLRHDYVVRELFGPYRLNDAKTNDWQGKFNLKPEWQGRDAGVAAFVQNRSSGEVLQAISLKLCS